MNEEFYGKEQYYDLWYELYKESLKGMSIGTGASVSVSGEIHALEYMKNKIDKEPILFDVGANIGLYTKELRRVFPKGEIHSFEPAKLTFEELKMNIGEDKKIILNNVGISDNGCNGILYYDKEKSGLASLYNRQLDYFGIEMSHQEDVKLDTLDHYCEINNISSIDILKMDIEGNEYKALCGAENLLKEKRIKAIQIEFGGCNIDSRTYFRDFWNLLNEDFKVYRILGNGLREIPRYGERLECFVTTNYLFVLKHIVLT